MHLFATISKSEMNFQCAPCAAFPDKGEEENRNKFHLSFLMQKLYLYFFNFVVKT